MKNKNLVSITDFTKEEYLRILELAAEFEKKPQAGNPEWLCDLNPLL